MAALAVGEGWICPGLQRAENAVVLVRNGRACWSPSDDCSCDIRPIAPGVVLGPPSEEPERTIFMTDVSSTSAATPEDPDLEIQLIQGLSPGENSEVPGSLEAPPLQEGPDDKKEP